MCYSTSTRTWFNRFFFFCKDALFSDRLKPALVPMQEQLETLLISHYHIIEHNVVQRSTASIE